MAASQRPAASTGVDYSTNPPTLAGLTLLATIPEDKFRLGYFIQCQDIADLVVRLDLSTDASTYVILTAAVAKGKAGGSLDMSSMPHSGRIRIYGGAGTDQMAARAW